MGYVEALLEWLEDLIERVQDYATRQINLLWDWVFYLNNEYKAVLSDLSALGDQIGDIPDQVQKAVEGARAEILNRVKEDLIDPLSFYVEAFQTDVQDWIVSLRSDISDLYEGLETVFKFIDTVEDVIDKRIDGYKDNVIEWIQERFISIVEHVLEQEVKE